MTEMFDYSAVNMPVSEHQLTELRRWFSDSGFPDAEIPEEYIKFLRESNGGDFLKNGREIQMFAVGEISEYYAAYSFSVYMPYALPFAMDGCGNFYIFNKRGRDDGIYLVAAGNMGWDDDECFLLAESFGEFIKGNFNN